MQKINNLINEIDSNRGSGIDKAKSSEKTLHEIIQEKEMEKYQINQEIETMKGNNTKLRGNTNKQEVGNEKQKHRKEESPLAESVLKNALKIRNEGGNYYHYQSLAMNVESKSKKWKKTL